MISFKYNGLFLLISNLTVKMWHHVTFRGIFANKSSLLIFQFSVCPLDSNDILHASALQGALKSWMAKTTLGEYCYIKLSMRFGHSWTKPKLGEKNQPQTKATDITDWGFSSNARSFSLLWSLGYLKPHLNCSIKGKDSSQPRWKGTWRESTFTLQ